MAEKLVNPVVAQDRAFDLWDTWQKYGYCMFPQQRRIYEQLAKHICGSVLEAGCGNGLGTAMLDYEDTARGSENGITGTDICEANYKFASELYPWIAFDHWDVLNPFGYKYDTVVAVEVLEHVADPVLALRNMLDACTKELWLSTPNGTGKSKPPENPHHVCEYTPFEVVDMLRQLMPGLLAFDLNSDGIYIYEWETFNSVGCNTKVDPLVYCVVKQ